MYFVYTSTHKCTDCIQVKELLLEYCEPVEYVIHEITGDALRKLPGSPTLFPYICFKDRPIGGYLQFKELLTDNLLRPRPDSDDRFVFDTKNIWAVDFFNKAQASFWLTKEIRLSDDVTQWANMPSETKKFIQNILAFFFVADGVVSESLAERYRSIQDPACRAFLGYQLYNEQIHSQTYALILKTLITNGKERNALLDTAGRLPHIRMKTDWCKKWISPSRLYAEKTVAYACVELIFFSASFCSIFWIKRQGILPGVSFSNELISRDEGLHGEFACVLYRNLVNKPADEVVYHIVQEAVDLEVSFVEQSMQVDMIGMRKVLLQDHVRYMGDRVLSLLGLPKKLYNVKSPYIDLIERQSMAGQTNFFEKNVSEYQRGTLGNELNFGDGI
jgi:ribonucleotide reductase beta subunit family protein with ferritin-like domain